MARCSSSSRIQRNIKEKNRRMQMKDLLRRLASLIPQTSKLSVPEIVNEATCYIKQLQENEERLKRMKALLKGEKMRRISNNMRGGSGMMNIRNLDSTLEVNLICGICDKNFLFCEIISILEEEGAEVINATQLSAGDRVICIIKSKAIIPRIGIETSRIEEKLKELIIL